MQQINTYMEKDISYIRQLMLNAILSPTVSDILKSDNTARYQSFNQWLNDYNLVHNMITDNLFSLDLHDVHILTDNALATAYYSDFCIDLSLLRNTPWYEEAQSTTYSFFFSKPDVFANTIAAADDYIYFTLKLGYLYNTYETYFVGALSKDILDSLISIENDSDFTFCCLINSKGEQLTANTNSDYLAEWTWLKENVPSSRSVRLENIPINGRNYYASVSAVHNTDLSLIYIYDYTQLMGKMLFASTWQYFLVFLLIVPAVFFFSIWIANSLTRNISLLNEQMLKVSEGDFKVNILPGNGKDEISDLNRHFNYMLTKISLLMDAQTASEKQIRKLEFAALQAQINPHFLYNTLELIKWKAVANKDYELGDIVDAMSAYYKIALSKGQELIPLHSELAHIEAYVYIQNKRFENGIHLKLDVPENYLTYRVPKLILQPIVENAILHGILESDSEEGTMIPCINFCLQKMNLLQETES